MTQPPAGRSGPFWEFLAGRQPAPPAAAALGWTLSWVAPERVLAAGSATARIIRPGPEAARSAR